MSSPEDNFWVPLECGRRVGLGTTKCGGQGSMVVPHDTSQSFQVRLACLVH